MSNRSAIEWTDATWNPTTGCTKVSPACANCYIERTPPFRVRGRVFVNGHIPIELHPDRLDTPLRRKKPTVYFVNSLSDLFHEDIPDSFLDRVFAVMALSPQHTFQVLTKRPERMRDYMRDSARHHDVTMAMQDQEHGVAGLIPANGRSYPRWPNEWPLPNVWLGVSAENQRWADERIPLLLQTPAAIRFISAEPLLELVDLGLSLATCSCCPRWSSRWVKVPRAIRADFPMNLVNENVATVGVHRAASNKHGALSVNGIGIRPDEFVALPSLDWVIVGGESGPRLRPTDPAWVRSIRDQCATAGVPFFFKQWGGKTAKAGGRVLDGRTWDEMPPIAKAEGR